MGNFQNFVQFSIVYTAKSNNPTILNPDFLKHNGIVDESWELKTPPICTEPFSQVQYKNNVIITSQLDKILFIINSNPVNTEEFQTICSIAKAYLELISHVNYNGIGINSNVLIETPENIKSSNYLIDHFLNKNFIEPSRYIENLALKFHIPISPDSKCNIEFVPIESVGGQKSQNKIMAATNFHHNINQSIDGKISKMNTIVDNYKNDIDKLTEEILPYFLGEN